jgi:general secretion pathway protein D
VLPAIATAQPPSLPLPPSAASPEPLPTPPLDPLGNTSESRAAAIARKQGPAPAAPNKESDDLDSALARPGDLNLHGLTLNAALFTIGEQWNINIVAGELQGTVNGVFKQAPLREILDAILLSNGYNYRAVGKSLVISSVAELGQVNPFFQSATIPVQNADIEEVVQGAQLLTTPKGQVRSLKSAHSIVVLDFPDRVKMIREFVATLDNAGNGRFPSAENRNGVPLEVGYFRTQHITAKTAEIALQAVLSKEGRVAVLEKEDRLLVTDFAENLAMAEKVLERVDHPRPQVRIVALLYDISLQDIERIGINWNPTFKGRFDSAGDPQTSLDIDSVTNVPFASGGVGNTLTFLNLSRNVDLTAVVRCIQTAKDARLLADPNVAVLENEEAILEKVSEIPYQQLTQTQQGGEIGTTAFKKAGITLHVRPKIASDGIIRMEVRPEVSRLIGFTPGDNQPIIDTSSTSTVLTVANRQLVVMGGLRQRQDVGEFNGVPYLKDLKGIGRLFRARDTEVRESELIVFIMPEIIPYADPPNCRQQLAGDTVDCRLNQIPEAEGCPPCCRRLPPGAFPEQCAEGSYGAPAPAGMEPGNPGNTIQPPPVYQNSGPQPDNSIDTLPAPLNLESPEPMSATKIPSAEFQFGITGRRDEVRALMEDGSLRRLPAVEVAMPSPFVGKVRVASLFTRPEPAAPEPPVRPEVRTAELPVATTVIQY